MLTSREKAIGVIAFLIGGGTGFASGVLSVKGARELVVAATSSEQRADVGKTTVVDRPGFRFEHPSNWKIDVSDKDHDPDHMFTLDTPGQSFMMFIVAEAAVDPKETLETYVTAQQKVVKGGTREGFTRWGSFDGAGAVLRGKHLGITPGSIRVFAWQSGDRTFTAIESTFDEDRAKVSPGFELVARTFQVKPAP